MCVMYAGPVGWFGGNESEFAVGIRSALVGKASVLWIALFMRVSYAMLLDEEEIIFYDTKVDNHGEPLEFSSGEGLVKATLSGQ
ncbi:uncharacterized protein A4U43_C08F5230 [Asparagus officinalis]|nr:uncharacterized protein A4U43_C08F5230 [Asparagus officinalis]